MAGGRRVFYNIDKIKMFLRGTPTDSGSVGYFSLQSFVSCCFSFSKWSYSMKKRDATKPLCFTSKWSYYLQSGNAVCLSISLAKLLS